eukprot:TRINITY_DN8754_c0_g1_i2.p1 TRINITY_DN8754_c0_g1~~TRINITY_DN8754_c0_g1_i2.p1  ORF type:complete len:655 (-),score=78.71 TRINITY_DN8754_c0_g1_i2:627-2591(-)
MSQDGHREPVAGVALSDDHVVTGSFDGTAKLWDRYTGQCIWTFAGDEGHTASVYSVALDGLYLVTGSADATAKCWSLSGQHLKTYVGHSEDVYSVALQGVYVLTGSVDNTAMLWDRNSGERLQTYEGHTKWVCSVALQDSYVLTGSCDTSAKLWDRDSGNCLRDFLGHAKAVWSVVLDDSHVLTGSEDTTAMLWDRETGSCLRTYGGDEDPKDMHAKEVRSVALYDAVVLTGSLDKTAKLWERDTGKCVKTFERHKHGVRCVALDGQHIVTGGYGGKAMLWLPEGHDPVVIFADVGKWEKLQLRAEVLITCVQFLGFPFGSMPWHKETARPMERSTQAASLDLPVFFGAEINLGMAYLAMSAGACLLVVGSFLITWQVRANPFGEKTGTILRSLVKAAARLVAIPVVKILARALDCSPLIGAGSVMDADSSVSCSDGWVMTIRICSLLALFLWIPVTFTLSIAGFAIGNLPDGYRKFIPTVDMLEALKECAPRKYLGQWGPYKDTVPYQVSKQLAVLGCTWVTILGTTYHISRCVIYFTLNTLCVVVCFIWPPKRPGSPALQAVIAGHAACVYAAILCLISIATKQSMYPTLAFYLCIFPVSGIGLKAAFTSEKAPSLAQAAETLRKSVSLTRRKTAQLSQKISQKTSQRIETE